MPINRLSPYGTDYKEKCFSIWYASGRKDLTEIRDTFPKDEKGRIPGMKQLWKWRREDGWDARADDLDTKALTIVENDLVQRKVEMLRRQAEVGFELQRRAMDYLQTEGFDSSASAVQAIKVGAEMERSSRGIDDLIVRMSKMDDAELVEEIMSQITRATEAGQIVEGAVEEVGKTTDEE